MELRRRNLTSRRMYGNMRKYIIIIMIGCVASFVSINVLGADWQRDDRNIHNTGGDNDNSVLDDKIISYHDVQSITRDNSGHVKVWQKWVMSGEKKDYDHNYATKIEATERQKAAWTYVVLDVTKELWFLREIDCRNRSFSTLECRAKDNSGITIHSPLSLCEGVVDRKVIYIEPESSMEILYKKICK